MKNLIKILIPALLLIVSNDVYSQCDYAAGATITVSASGFESGTGFSQTYALVENSSNVIVDLQTSGSFASVGLGSYRIYAVNYEGTIPSVLSVDSLWSSVEAFSAMSENCMALLGPKDDTISVCESVCFGSTLSVSASGFEAGSGFSQTYVLVNKNDSIYASNASGNFDQMDYLDSGSVEVYAVNTSDASVKSEISNGGLWNDIETMELSTCTEYIGAQRFYVNTCAVLTNNKIIIEGSTETYTNKIRWADPEYASAIKYQVFKKSGAEESFVEIAEIENSSINYEMEFEDKNPGTDEYYRLLTTYKGETMYSNIVNLQRESSNLELVALYPNPTRDNVNVNILSPAQTRANIVVTDLLGKKCESKMVDLQPGINTVVFRLNEYPNGIYNMSVISDKENIYAKFVKTH